MTELLTERILIRITPSLKIALLAKAERKHIRLQDVCRNALAEYVLPSQRIFANGKKTTSNLRETNDNKH